MLSRISRDKHVLKSWLGTCILVHTCEKKSLGWRGKGGLSCSLIWWYPCTYLPPPYRGLQAKDVREKETLQNIDKGICHRAESLLSTAESHAHGVTVIWPAHIFGSIRKDRVFGNGKVGIDSGSSYSSKSTTVNGLLLSQCQTEKQRT